MSFIKSKRKNFFSDKQGYASRLQLIGLVLVVGMIFSELLLGQLGSNYPAHWEYVGFLGLFAIAFIFVIRQLEFTKKRLAAIATAFSLVGTFLLVLRCIETDFSPLILGQLLFALIIMSFVFERAIYLLAYLIGITLIFGSTLTMIALKNENHLFFLLIIGFVYSFYWISYSFKMGWINMLQFSENVLSSYDRYIIVFNNEGEAVYVSPFIIRQLGLDPKEVVASDWWGLRGISNEEISNYKSVIAERIRLNEEIPLYTQVLTVKNGATRIIEWNAQITGGKYYVGHGTDITDELDAKKESEKLSKVTQALGVGVVIANSEGEISWCNSSYCAIFGYEKEELIGKRPSEVFKVPEFFNESYSTIIQDGIETGKQFEIPHYRKDGNLIWVLVQSSSFAGDAETSSDTIEVVSDITRQKNSELEVKQISLIAERTQTPVLICDSLFTINWINSALLTEFGGVFEDIMGTDFLSFYAGEWAHDEPVEIVIDTIKNKRSCQVDIRLKGNGGAQWYKLSLDPIKDEYRNIEQFMLIMQNIQKSKDTQLLIEEKNRDMIASISYAKRIQSALLPDTFTLKNNLPPHFFYYQPKDIVSGDFYFAKSHLGKLYISIADCTGHGVPGAMISSIGAAALNNAIFDRGYSDPGVILEHADRYLKKTLSASDEGVTDGMDLGLLVFDFQKNEVNYSGARRPLVLLKKSNSEISIIPGNKRSIGEFIEEGMDPFRTESISIDQDYLVYLFTDGITDQFGGDSNKKVRFKPFLELIEQFSENEMSAQRNLFVEFFKSWTKNYTIEQTDDMLLFGANINPEYMNKMKSEIKRVVHHDN